MNRSDSNVGKWNHYFTGLDANTPAAFGSTETYLIGAEFLRPCTLVEDWGCGKGYLSTLIEPFKYRGVDGSKTPFADIIADLCHYRSRVSGIFMRHVLEHNFGWQAILKNALHSFEHRFCLVLFTPLAEQTHVLSYERNPEVPNISFSLHDIESRFGLDTRWERLDLKTATQFGTETVFLVER